MKKTKRIRRPARVRRSRKSGLPPGTAVFVGEQKQEEVQIHLIHFTPRELEEIEDAGVEDCARMKGEPGITWVHVNGLHDIRVIQQLADLFGLHPLTTEDIINTTQRPKAEEFEDYMYFTLKMLTYDESAAAIRNENVSMILGSRVVLTFQERSTGVLRPLRARLQAGNTRVRGGNTDYLAYAILDAIVDEYFTALEKLGDHIEVVDEEILSAPDGAHMRELHRLKREVVVLRKAVWPLREEISAMTRSESPLIGDSIRIFLRDLYDHTIQVIDMVETYRDLLGGMDATYLSTLSNRMNEVMKVLTMIGTIFIPLTFIAGIYGMNFEHMPELEWRWGYAGVMLLMGLLAVSMLVMFRKKRWL